MNVSKFSSPFVHFSQITAMAIGLPSFGVMTHCFVLSLGSSSPSLSVWTRRMLHDVSAMEWYRTNFRRNARYPELKSHTAQPSPDPMAPGEA